MARRSLLRMLLTQPVSQPLTPERHRGVARVRLIIVLAALLGLDALIIVVCLVWSPGRAWRTITMVGVVLEMMPTMWWLHLTGSVSELSADLEQAAAGTLDAARRARAAPLLALARREQFLETPTEALAPTMQASD